MNTWHDVPLGKNAPEVVNMVVEIPKDSQVKYELDKDTGLLKTDRFIHSAIHYPADYGFIPRTLWEDDDPLDILVYGSKPVFPLTLCEVRVIGVVRMIDDEESDDKIVAVHANDPRFSEWTSVENIPKHHLKEIEHFFETYKHLQKKVVKVYKIDGVEEAYESINRARKLYEERFEK